MNVARFEDVPLHDRARPFAVHAPRLVRLDLGPPRMPRKGVEFGVRLLDQWATAAPPSPWQAEGQRIQSESCGLSRWPTVSLRLRGH
jgi:hypothetical protein